MSNPALAALTIRSRRVLAAAFTAPTLAMGLVPVAHAQVGAPKTPVYQAEAFRKTFHDGVAVVDGTRIHYVEGGHGSPLLLVPGWPESWYAWRLVMPALAASGHHVVAIDPRGMGDSDHPETGYDARTAASDLHGLVTALGLATSGPIDVAAHDVGSWLAYAYAADYPADVRKLAVFEAALAGITPPAPAGTPDDAVNLKTWHFAFNRLPDLPEMLVQGHERAYLAWLFNQKARKPWVFTPEVIDEYTRVFTRPGGARAAFSYYREAFGEAGIAQNRERARKKLQMPVLAVGGQYGVGDALQNTMKLAAADVSGTVLPGCGHFVLEECPIEVTTQLETFFK